MAGLETHLGPMSQHTPARTSACSEGADGCTLEMQRPSLQYIICSLFLLEDSVVGDSGEEGCGAGGVEASLGTAGDRAPAVCARPLARARAGLFSTKGREGRLAHCLRDAWNTCVSQQVLNAHGLLRSFVELLHTLVSPLHLLNSVFEYVYSYGCHIS